MVTLDVNHYDNILTSDVFKSCFKIGCHWLCQCETCGTKKSKISKFGWRQLAVVPRFGKLKQLLAASLSPNVTLAEPAAPASSPHQFLALDP